MESQVRAMTDADLDDFVRIRNQGEPHQITAADAREIRARRDPGVFRRDWVVEAEGLVVGYGSLQADAFDPGWLVPFVKVDSQARGRGYGPRLWDAVLEAAREVPMTGMNAFVQDRDPGSRAWAEERGFRLHAHRFRSLLDTGEFDPARFGDPPGGVELGVTEDWPRVWKLVAGLFPQAPDGLAVPDASWFESEVSGRAGSFAILAEIAGRDVGLAVLHPVPPVGEGGWFNFFTGVDASARGRGLALALKVLATGEAVRRGARRISTFNLSTNAPMLAVNQKLGYQPLPGVWWFKRAG